MEVVYVLNFFTGVMNLLLALVGGYGFGYAIHQLSPLGKLKFKPFSCIECLSFWGSGVIYGLMTYSLPAAITIGLVSIVLARFLGAIEFRIATGGRENTKPPCGGCGGNVQTTVKVEGSEENG